MGKFRDAQRETDVLLKMFPNDPEILNNSCWLHAALWELNAALPDCNKSLALAREANTLDSLGFLHLRMRNYKQALADYNAALALAPNHASSLYVRGVIKRRLGDVTGGDADIKAAGKIDPEIAESFAPYGLTEGN
jgi:tetratricopeptide (TPR) repeat protein